ncbi:MAG: hypothetical protein K2X27_00355 [Candidatus Obscuribacterales bacterium]|nr:hypothetical protein [Candidatus Obscuribacterales bacterium]
MHNMFALDLALFGCFISLSIGVIFFRRFHEYESSINEKDLGAAAWGLYPNKQESLAPALVRQNRSK